MSQLRVQADQALLDDPEVKRLLAEADEILAANPLQGYMPHEKQKPFHAFRGRTKVFLGGNRSGKTTGGICDDLIQAIDPDAVPEHLKEYKKWEAPFKCRIVTPDFTRTMIAVQEAIRRWCPKSQLKGGGWDTAYEKSQRILRFANGSFFEFMTYEQDIDKFGGSARHRCLDEETEILTRGGWRGIDGVGVGDEILTLVPETGAYEWRRVRQMFRDRETRMVRLSSRNNFEALVTGDHRWLVFNKKTGRTYFTTTDELKKSEQLIVGSSSGPVEKKEHYADELVGLVGWVITDGWVSRGQITIAQSLTANATKCEKITALVGGRGAEYDRPYDTSEGAGILRNFAVHGDLRREALDIVGEDKELPEWFIDKLSTRQRQILLDAIIDGDGCRNYDSGRWSITSGNPQHQRAITYLATLLGWRTSVRPHPEGWSMILAKSKSGRYNYNRVSVDSLTIEEVEYDGEIWCPSTDAGTVVALRNGAVFVTGNCHYDEEPPGEKGELVRQECTMRLADYNGDELFTFTPLLGLTWTFDELWENKGPEIAPSVWEDEGLCVVRVDMDDNPHLSQEGKDAALAAIPEEYRAARKEGNFVHFQGLVYSEWDSSRHVCDPVDKEHLKGQTYQIVIDPGIHKTAVLFGAFDKDNHLLIFDELLLQGHTPERTVSVIRAKEKFWGIKDAFYLIDPAARNRSLTDAERVESSFQKAGLPVVPAQNDVETGIFEVKRRLEKGLLTVARNCQNLLWERERYRLAPTTDGKFAVVKRHDHAMDCLRYVAMSRPLIHPEIKQRPRRWTPGTAPPADYEPIVQDNPPMGGMS